MCKARAPIALYIRNSDFLKYVYVLFDSPQKVDFYNFYVT